MALRWRFHTQSHPNEMHVIGHEHISGAEETFASGGVQKQFAEVGVEHITQAIDGAVLKVIVQWTTAKAR